VTAHLRTAICLCALATACGGEELRGGHTVATGDEPGGQVLGSWVPSECRDARGGVSGRPTRVFLVQPVSGSPVLVEVRDGYDSVVVENSFAENQQRVFQLVAETDSGVIYLHDFRVPATGAGPGRMAAAARWREVERSDGRFQAYPEAPLVTCTLAPQLESEPAAAPAPAPG
jgi:hypothetical protein